MFCNHEGEVKERARISHICTLPEGVTLKGVAQCCSDFLVITDRGVYRAVNGKLEPIECGLKSEKEDLK